MKKIILSLLAIGICFCKAQNISIFTLQTNCPITITAPIDSAFIFGAAAVTNDTVASYLWKQTSGPVASIVNPAAPQTIVRKLTPGSYTFSLTVTTKKGNVQTILNDQVTVNAAPIARKVKSFTMVLVNGAWVPTFTYDDGSSQ